MLGEVLAEVTRSGVVESVHAGHLVLLNADGSILFQKGDPTLDIYSRSSLKSIQASAMVRAGLDIEPRFIGFGLCITLWNSNASARSPCDFG